jgi:hypothetical protein
MRASLLPKPSAESMFQNQSNIKVVVLSFRELESGPSDHACAPATRGMHARRRADHRHAECMRAGARITDVKYLIHWAVSHPDTRNL